MVGCGGAVGCGGGTVGIGGGMVGCGGILVGSTGDVSTAVGLALGVAGGMPGCWVDVAVTLAVELAVRVLVCVVLGDGDIEGVNSPEVSLAVGVRDPLTGPMMVVVAVGDVLLPPDSSGVTLGTGVLSWSITVCSAS
jgi:hypothetical protein